MRAIYVLFLLLTLALCIPVFAEQTMRVRLFTSNTQSFPFGLNVNGTVTLKVLGSGGILDGGLATLTLYDYGGKLEFTNYNTVNVTLLSDVNASVLWRLNGATVPYNSTIVLLPMQPLTLTWETGVGDIYLPVMMYLGVFGLIGLIVFPTVAVYKVKKGDYAWLMWGLIGVLICIALTIGWLSGGG